MELSLSQHNDSTQAHVYLDDEALPNARTSLIILATLAVMLWVDSLVPLWGQVLAGVMAWALVGAIYLRMPRRSQHLLMSCLVMAMFGEVFCSLIWKLYDYRLFNIPPYVPPGHLMMFLLGSSMAPRMPRFIVWLVPLLVAPYVALGWWLDFDRFGLPLFAMFIACLVAEKNRRLYATMFMLCMALEVYGTWLGNWTWRPEAPIWGMSTTSPPISAGVFYCLLDFLMLRLALAFWAGQDRYSQISWAPAQNLRTLLRPLTEQTGSAKLFFFGNNWTGKDNDQ